MKMMLSRVPSSFSRKLLTHNLTKKSIISSSLSPSPSSSPCLSPSFSSLSSPSLNKNTNNMKNVNSARNMNDGSRKCALMITPTKYVLFIYIHHHKKKRKMKKTHTPKHTRNKDIDRCIGAMLFVSVSYTHL